MKRKSLLFILLIALFAPLAMNAQTSLFSENFEGGSMPTGWTTDGPGTWRVGSGDYSTSTGAGLGTYNALITHGNTGDVTKLITPEIDLSSVTSAMLSFMHVQRSWAGDTDNLKVYYRTSSSEAWTQLVAYTSAISSWTTEEDIILPNTTATYQLAFEHTDNYGYGVGLDQVVITPPAACPKPTLGQAEYISEEGASFQWTENGSATQWQLQYSTSTDFTDPTTIDRNGIPAYAITGLSSGTTYYVHLRSYCGDGEYSDWSNVVTFTTLCSAYNIPYTYGFEEAGPFECWTVISGTVTRIGYTSNTGTYRLDFRGTTSNMIALPQFNEATNNLRVEFWTRPESTGGYSGKFAIGYMTDITDASTFVAVDTYNSTEMTATYVKKTVDLVNVPANANIAMRQFDCSTNFYWYVDDVTVKEIPSCVAPTALDAANVSTTSAELSWTANSGETAWTLYWKKTTDENYTEVANANSPYLLNGLTAGTDYQFYVVANCSADETSEPSEVFPFTTECDVITITESWSENFNSLTAGIPNCWDNSEGTTTTEDYKWNYYNAGHDGAGLRFNSYSNSNGNTNFLKTPTLSLPADQVMQLTFWYKNPTGGDFSVYISTDGGATYTTALATGLTGVSSWTEHPVIYLADYAGQEVVIVFKGTSNYGSGEAYIYLDDVTVMEAPTCLNPTDVEVTTNAFTATITWESEVGEYEVAYSTDNTANPDENIAGTATEETYTMNDLALGDHYFWVRANCGSDGYSEWVGPVSVHFGYCVPTPSNVDGNGISNVTFGMGDNIVNNDTPKAMYADYSSQIGAVQAGVESTIAITYATGYDYGTIIWVDLDNSLSFEDSEIMFVGNAPNSTAPYNAAITIPATQTPGDYMMRIGGADSGFDSYISDPSTTAPSACYNGSWACFQDYTLRVLEAPSCMMPTGLAINYTGGTTATVTWEGTAETYNIDVNGTVINNVTTPYTLEDLELATTYAVMVQANCENNETSEWTTAVSFTTDFCLPEDMCEITLELTDDYGDGWNGNYIQVVDGETNAVLGEFTNTSEAAEGEAQTFTLPVCNGREISFVYGLGNDGSTYPYENSFVIYDVHGEIICQHELDDDGPTPGVVGTYTVNCGFVSYTLEIEGVGEENWNNENNSGYYLIASPVTVDLTNHDMTTGDFDLYYFDQVGDEDGNEWMNYKNESFNLEPGKGYLYAHKTGGEFTLTGTAYDGDGTIELTYDENATSFQGWNLVGNPWGVKAYPDHAFYTMAEGGAGIDVTPNVAGTEVARMTGIFVVAEAANETVTFSTEAPANTDGKIALNLTNSNKLVDRAIVRFGEGRQLPKFQLNPNHTKVYFQQEGKDYAIVNATEMGEMPVSFKAENNGIYSLSFTSEEVSFSYLHLIDNMTGNDVNLLQTPSYTFDARTSDYESRFRLVFATGSSANDDTFGFVNASGNFCIFGIEGEATVQVIDVLGHMLSNEQFSGSYERKINGAPGVYMVRLINGNEVRTQKVVVR